MSSEQELACVYAALVLQDDGVSISGEKISMILNAAGVAVEPFWPGLFAKALQGIDVNSLITSGIGQGYGKASGEGTVIEAEKIAEDGKKIYYEDSRDYEMMFGLFD